VAQSGGLGIDSQSRAHLRNIDTQLTHVLQEVSQGRNQSVQELRSEIKLLARTIAAVGGSPDHRA
jgi:recombinational DNA repair ATPase RecF